ncbi:MAG TPA: CRTAC1 family protein, partial [Candidatus Synoicihabitans sp.]|nr:CRTAC1 family protein [Candidatus Synoicihabitans sp.]
TNQLLTITEPRAGETAKPARPSAPGEAPTPLFREVSASLGINYVGEESEVNEFTRQVLLPRRLSGFGPGIAVAELQPGAGEALVLPGAIFTRAGAGWQRAAGPGPRLLAPLVFDATGDGRVDVFYSNGSVAHAAGEAALADQLFVGSADGAFTPASADALPANHDTSGPVVAADFDGDGDLDLFVGGRVVPMKYPETPESRLLRNDHGRFVDVTDEWAPGLRRVGLVSSALWSDADNDGRIDLLLTCEWGPVMLWRNLGQRFEDVTVARGLAERTGWWTSIAGADVDGDGRIDYVVGNYGLNTKYRATPSEPAVLFAGDLDGTGKHNVIEGRWENGRLYPVRGRSKSAYAMPSLRRKFRTFDAWARATIEEIVGPERLAAAQRLEANELASGVWLNRGDRFEFRPLPTLAQVAPIFGQALQDFDGDGYVDLLVAQNFYGPEPKTGRFDGGLSLLLRGDGRGNFAPIEARESGILVPGDAKALAVLDLGDDGRPDAVVTQNAGRVLVFEQAQPNSGRNFSVALAGVAGNPHAIGGRITVKYRDGHDETRELAAGAGHLSQSSPRAFFGYRAENPPAEIAVRWPDGHETTHPWSPTSTPHFRLAR